MENKATCATWCPPPADGVVSGRHYRTGECLRVRWKQGRIQSCEAVPEQDDLPWLAPALVDLQVNGYGGVDFQQDELSAEALAEAARALRRDGCGRFLLTLITDEWEKLLGRLRRLVQLRKTVPELQSAIAGWHIEGPFLSAEPGFSGAHDPGWMIDPKTEHVQALRAAAEDHPVLLTLAPERSLAPEIIAAARSLGMTVSLGHTDATAAQLEQALAAGASTFTHLGNGCCAALDRKDNILWRAFDAPIQYVSVIPDGTHVSPALFRAMHRVVRGQVFYVSDAMAAAGAPPGSYKLGRLQLEVGADGVVRRPGSPYLAGSALRPVEGVWRASQMLGCSWQESWRRYSEVPAKLMQLGHEIAPGEPLNLCVVEVRPERLVARVLA